MAKKHTTAKKSKLETLNETGARKKGERRSKTVSSAVAGERRKTRRRRQIDPTTCEREYNDAEIEFMHALDEYKRASGRMFPTCSEILEVFVGLGYRRVAAPSECFSMDNVANNQEQGASCSEFDTEIEEEEFESQTV